MSSNNFIPLPPSTILPIKQRKQKEIKVKVGSTVPLPPIKPITKYDHPYFINDFKIGSGEKKLRIITISDTHNKHKNLEIPEGQLIFNFTNGGSKRKGTI
ncbi:hypothetical protein ABK040_011002 [Willaertia magna]